MKKKIVTCAKERTKKYEKSSHKYPYGKAGCYCVHLRFIILYLTVSYNTHTYKYKYLSVCMFNYLLVFVSVTCFLSIFVRYALFAKVGNTWRMIY